MMNIDECRSFVQEMNEKRWELEDKNKRLQSSLWKTYRKFQDIFEIDVYSPEKSTKDVQEMRLFFIEQLRS